MSGDYRRGDPHHPDRCGACGRLTKRNKDGHFIQHRPVADTFFGAYCPGVTSTLTELDIEDDPRDNACPECPEGEVVNAGPREWETGHQPYTCDQLCGFHG